MKIMENPSTLAWNEVKIEAAVKPKVDVKPGVEDFEVWKYSVECSSLIENFVDMMYEEIEIASFANVPISGFTAEKTQTSRYFRELLRLRVAYVNNDFGNSKSDIYLNATRFLAPAVIQQLLSQVGVVEVQDLQVRLCPEYAGEDFEQGKPFSNGWLEFMTHMSKQMRLINNLIHVFESPRLKTGNVDVLSFVWKNERLYNRLVDKHPTCAFLASLLKTSQGDIFSPMLARVSYGTKSYWESVASQPDLIQAKMYVNNGKED